MYYDINNIQTIKEMVQNLFQELQIVYQNIFISLLDELDDWLMNNRDYKRFENRERQKCTIATMFGDLTINRRKYFDWEAFHRIALLDQYLQFSGSESLSPFIREMAVTWALKGPCTGSLL